ncbi:hypothetical protein J6590_047813 [Homalodisca vitripennis]|nr:hypothetical protein J6590_047813 [Homalodisca vitripennis]
MAGQRTFTHILSHLGRYQSRCQSPTRPARAVEASIYLGSTFTALSKAHYLVYVWNFPKTCCRVQDLDGYQSRCQFPTRPARAVEASIYLESINGTLSRV